MMQNGMDVINAAAAAANAAAAAAPGKNKTKDSTRSVEAEAYPRLKIIKKDQQ